MGKKVLSYNIRSPLVFPALLHRLSESERTRFRAAAALCLGRDTRLPIFVAVSIPVLEKIFNIINRHVLFSLYNL